MQIIFMYLKDHTVVPYSNITCLITFIAVPYSEEIYVVTLAVEEEKADPRIESVNGYDK
jgi:hypothetical protein